MSNAERELELVIKAREATQEAFKKASAEVKGLKDDVSHASHEIESLEDQYVKIFSGQARKGMHGLGTGILEDADAVVAAVGRIGGAAKLTEAEQGKINKIVSEAVEKYRALGQQAPAALVQLAEATRGANPPVEQGASWWKQFGDQVKASALGFVSAQAALGAVQAVGRGVVQFLGDSVTAAASAEAAQRKLTQALATQGLQTPKNVAALSDLSSEFQDTTVYADDLTMEMEGLLVQIGGVAPAQMRRALQAATDLASGLGIDLRTATVMVGKAFAGETSTLSRYGVVIDDAKVRTEGATAVMDAIQQRFGGQAQAELDTYAGKVKQLANTWDDLQEVVGGSIINDPTLQASLQGVAESIRGTGEAGAEAKPRVTEWIAAFTLLPGAGRLVREFNDELELAVSLQRQLGQMGGQVKSPFAAWADERSLKVIGDDMELLRSEASALLSRGLQPLSQEQRALILQFTKAGLSVKDIAEKMGIYESSVTRVIKADQEAAKAKERAADAAKKFRDAVKQTSGTFQAYIPLADAMNARTAAMRNLWRGLAEDGTLMVAALRDQFGPMQDTTQWLVGLAPAIKGSVDKGFRESLKGGGFADWAKGLGPLVSQGLTGGGGIGGAVKAFATQTTAQFVDAFVPGLGSALAPAVGWVFGKIGGLFGKSAGRKELEEYNKKIKEFGQEWIASAGGIDRARQAAALFGQDLDAILNNQGKQGFANVKADLGEIDNKLDELRDQLPAIFDDVNRFGGQLPERFAPFVEQMKALGILQGDQGFNWQRLQGDAERYGISVAALGPKINGARLKEQAKDILDVWEEMEANNADMSGVLAGMSDEISALVQESLKFGTEIPSNMKPMIEQLLASGQLLDENGHKMTDISGIQFGEPIKVGLDAVVDRLDKLLEGLGIKLPDAIAGGVDQAVLDTDRLGAAVRKVIGELPDHIEIPVDFPTRGPVIPSEREVPEGHSGLVGNWGSSGSLVRLHNFEAAIPLDRPSTLPSAVLQQVVSQNPQAFPTTGGAGSPIVVQLIADGKQLAEVTVPYIPGVVTQYGLR